MSNPTAGSANLLGRYLKDRRARLDPSALGFPQTRRRTPGLRREEVAQLANVSVTWYTWLEQGRGGEPSADVLDGLATALRLTAVEREHLFLLAQRRPPEVQYRPPEPVSPRLQRVLDSLESSPAYLKTATWDIVAWNRATTVVLWDYGAMPPDRRNVLRLFFLRSELRERLPDWERVARFVVATFRADSARAGASRRVAELVEELSDLSPDFARMWRDNDVSTHGEGTKVLDDSRVGRISLEYSAFQVDGQPQLSLVIYSPSTPEDVTRVRTLMDAAPSTPGPPRDEKIAAWSPLAR